MRTDLAFEVGLRLELPLLFETIHNILVSPANLVRQALQNCQINDETRSCIQLSYLYCAVLPARLQPQYPQSLWNDHPLFPVVWWRNAFIQLKAFQSSSAPRGFVGNHATNGTVKNLRRCSMVEGA